MKITKQTKLSECAIFLSQEDLDLIADNVPVEYLSKYDSIISDKIGNFIQLIKGDQKYFQEYFFKDNQDITVYEYAARLKHLKIEIDKVVKYLNSLSIKQTDEEIQAAKGVDFPTFEQNILIYVQQKFFLHSIKEVYELPLSDFILHKKSDMANVKYEKNLRMLYERKNNFKGKK